MCSGDEISKDDIKCLEKARHQQANSHPDSGTAGRVSFELKFLLLSLILGRPLS